MKIAILTSGGDAPGMNAAIRAMVRLGISNGHEMIGILRGYQGLMTDEKRILGPRDVSNIIQRGGTFLHTTRSKEFQTEEGVRKAASRLDTWGVEALLAIGGDGTFRGCAALGKHWKGRIIGVPGTIDNDLWGTDYTIGFDTAVETALESIDKIRDTAESHERIFIVEVMGRHSGFIALHVGITGGAEEVLVPEAPQSLETVYERLRAGKARGKSSSLVVVAEGAHPEGGKGVSDELFKLSGGYRCHLCVLGHIQRGGKPSAADRMLATRLGAFALESAVAGATGKMAGEVNGVPTLVDFRETFDKKKSLDSRLLDLVPHLSV